MLGRTGITRGYSTQCAAIFTLQNLKKITKNSQTPLSRPFYGNIEKEVASTEEVEGFRYNLGMGSGITGGTVEVGISVSAPKFAVPLKR